ncbi:alpha/beta-hydrolase [Laetiporus sulphureus 93-53]|uniref:Alpha/beta-hydrolase n=1 Tax=Laetiporus sulphureus 93-53 TaxID=1314785 RepID=A0A165H4P1_9APHY|nr:alpha/beta-hydrolase [Laetiporus sulphureus 93-53]KZT11240.1 alpha/beta-hydrolase [Laetiporus sulphureus 93-53]
MSKTGCEPNRQKKEKETARTRITLMRRSAPTPLSKKTATGGSRKQKLLIDHGAVSDQSCSEHVLVRTLQMSEPLNGIVADEDEGKRMKISHPRGSARASPRLPRLAVQMFRHLLRLVSIPLHCDLMLTRASAMSGPLHSARFPHMHSHSSATTSELEEYIGIPYTTAQARSVLHEFDLYVPRRALNVEAKQTRGPPLICFVHGGAWRSEDKAEHAPLARRLALRTRFPVAVPNYRLTTSATPIRHPAHAQDILEFLEFLLSWSGPDLASDRAQFDPSRLYLIGHSCSAHMLTSIFLQPRASASVTPLQPNPSSPSDLPPSPLPTSSTLSPSPALLASTCAVIMSSGLYNLDLLLRSYPAYKSWFVAPTFGRLQTYAPWNTASYELRSSDEVQRSGTRWFVVHSKSDTLVDRLQSEAIWERLRVLYGEEQSDDGGGDLATEGKRMIERDWEGLTEEHNEALAGETYPRIVGDWILDDVRWRAGLTTE